MSLTVFKNQLTPTKVILCPFKNNYLTFTHINFHSHRYISISSHWIMFATSRDGAFPVNVYIYIYSRTDEYNVRVFSMLFSRFSAAAPVIQHRRVLACCSPLRRRFNVYIDMCFWCLRVCCHCASSSHTYCSASVYVCLQLSALLHSTCYYNIHFGTHKRANLYLYAAHCVNADGWKVGGVWLHFAAKRHVSLGLHGGAKLLLGALGLCALDMFDGWICMWRSMVGWIALGEYYMFVEKFSALMQRWTYTMWSYSYQEWVYYKCIYIHTHIQTRSWDEWIVC